jgi:hypothetical protein
VHPSHPTTTFPTHQLVALEHDGGGAGLEEEEVDEGRSQGDTQGLRLRQVMSCITSKNAPL